jgi:glutamate synthase (ferredoxin)
MFTSLLFLTRWQVVNLEDIIAERDACGVGFIASLKNEGSHSIVEAALTALGCMEHRGGCGADNDSGDGAGLMTKIPWQLLNRWFQENGLPPLDESHTGVGMVFLSKDESGTSSLGWGGGSGYLVMSSGADYRRDGGYLG